LVRVHCSSSWQWRILIGVQVAWRGTECLPLPPPIQWIKNQLSSI